MRDFIEENPDIHVEDLRAGMDFLIERELLVLVTEDEEGRQFYGVTDEGLRALYMLGLVMASGVTSDEIDGKLQDPKATQVSRCAADLVAALDGLAILESSEV